LDIEKCFSSLNAPMSGDERTGDELKEEANQQFAAQKYKAAIELYTLGLERNPTAPAVLYANRALCHLRLENFGSAILDATSAIEVDPKYAKAYYRRASGNFGLGHYKTAARDFRQVVLLAPRDRNARLRYTECQKEARRVAFEKAIAGEPQPPMSQRLNIDEMVIESDYKGLVLEFPLTLIQVKEMMERFRRQEKIHVKNLYEILRATETHLRSQRPLVDVTIPENGAITVCGDTHGQYYDLLNIFEKAGLPSETHAMLFNGDFVDRGSFSAEVVISLFALQCVFPNRMFLSRGNHETVNMNRVYGFFGEIKAKYGATAADFFTEVFQCLPLCHLIESKILVVHGGIFSQDGVKLSQIRAIDRFREPPDEGLMTELLWSDPQPMPGRAPSKRGVGVSFGPDVTKRFLEENELSLLVRSHEVKDEGYEVTHDGKCITVFSAPNYCDSLGNKGAYITFRAGDSSLEPHFTTFKHVDHPKIPPMAYAGMMSSMMG